MSVRAEISRGFSHERVTAAPGTVFPATASPPSDRILPRPPTATDSQLQCRELRNNLFRGLPSASCATQAHLRAVCGAPGFGEGPVTGSPHLVMDAWPHHHGRPNCFGFLRQPSRPTGAEVGCDLALRRRHWLANSTMVIPPISKIQFQRNPNIVVPINRSMW